MQSIAHHAAAPVCKCGGQMKQILTPVRGFADTPDYQSPIDGRVVHGRRGRRADLARHNCRPYEGREVEEREAARHRQEQDRKLDSKIHSELSASYESLSTDSKKALEHLTTDITTERN